MTLGKQARSNARMMIARGFLKQFSIQKDKTYTYPVEWNDKLGMIIIRLNLGEIVTTGKKVKEVQPLNLQSFADITINAID